MYLSMYMLFSDGHMCLVPYGASIYGKEAFFAVEVVPCRLEVILEMACIEGEHLICSCLLHQYIFGIMVHLDFSWCAS